MSLKGFSVSKGFITLCAGAGGTLGGYLPVLLGASSLGGWSILGAFTGGIAGIWLGFTISNR